MTCEVWILKFLKMSTACTLLDHCKCKLFHDYFVSCLSTVDKCGCDFHPHMRIIRMNRIKPQLHGHHYFKSYKSSQALVISVIQLLLHGILLLCALLASDDVDDQVGYEAQDDDGEGQEREEGESSPQLLKTSISVLFERQLSITWSGLTRSNS